MRFFVKTRRTSRIVFFTFKSKNALFTFLPFYFFTFKSFFTFKLFQLGKFFFPVREVILDVFLNHNAKLRHPELAVSTYGYIGVFKGTFSFKKIFALDLRLSEVVDDDFYLSWVVRLAIALVARYCELIHERFVALDPRLEVFSRSLWRAVGKVKESQLLLGVSSNFKFFHDDDFLFKFRMWGS